MVIQGAPRELQKHQNRVKMTSRAVLQTKGWKKLRKSAFSGKLDMQSAHACAVQTHFFVFALRPEKWSKKPPKSSSKSSKIHSKNASRARQEFMQKKLTHKTQKMLKSVEKGSQKGLGFRAGNVFKIITIRDFFKMGPQASKMSPWSPKSTQNHESDRPKSRKSSQQTHEKAKQSER